MMYPNPTWEIDSRSNFYWPRFHHHRLFSCPSFLGSLRHGVRFLIEKTWQQENIEKFMMLNKRRRWFHSSRVKKSLSLTCLRVGFWYQPYLIWICGSKWILSNNQSSATLWVQGTCLIVGLVSSEIILITASLSHKCKASRRIEKVFRL